MRPAIVFVLALALAGWPFRADETSTTQPGPVPQIPPPAIGSDSFGLIAGTGWGDQPPVRPPSDFVVLDSSTPTQIDLLVFDNACGPVVIVDAVADAPKAGLRVTMTSMDDAFGEAGYQCSDVSHQYIVAVTLARPGDTESLSIDWGDQRIDR